MKSGATNREVLASLVEQVIFLNRKNGFCVLRTKARGHRDLVTVVGHAAMVSPGDWITTSGEWVNNRNHGQQFKAHFLRSVAPSSVKGIEKYLGSGTVRGIGPVFARKVVQTFGRSSISSRRSPNICAKCRGLGRSGRSASPMPGRSISWSTR